MYKPCTTHEAKRREIFFVSHFFVNRKRFLEHRMKVIVTKILLLLVVSEFKNKTLAILFHKRKRKENQIQIEE